MRYKAERTAENTNMLEKQISGRECNQLNKIVKDDY